LTIVGIVVGILTWQTIITIILIVTKENEELTIYVGGGIPFWITAGVCKLIRMALKKVCYYSVRSILTDENGNWFYCRPEIADKLREDENKNLNFPRWTDEMKTKYPKTMWSKYIQSNCCSSGVGNMRYAPKEIWQQFPEVK